MKGKDGIEGINQTAINTTPQPRTKKAEKEPTDKSSLGEILGRRGNDSEKIHLSLGRAIKEELGLEKFHAERRARVEELKALIKEGKYNPPTEKVAESVGRELAMEILTAPPTKEDENL